MLPSSVAPSTSPAGRAWWPEPVARRTTRWSAGALAVAAALGLLLPGPAASAGPWLLVAAGLVGLPHGAVDHLAIGWARGRTSPALLVAYAATAVVVAAVAVAVPGPAVLALLALSAAHFAEGEAAFDRLRGGAGRLLPAAAIGTSVVALPLLLHPAQADPVLATLDPGLPALLAGARPVLLVLVAALVLAGACSALAGVRSGLADAQSGLAHHVASRPSAWRVPAELALVVTAAALCPPLLVFAAWFAGWHSTRHLVRLAALEPSGTGRQRATALARGAALPTAVAVAGLVALALLLGGLPGAVLVTLLALTVPHAVVVARLGGLQAPR